MTPSPAAPKHQIWPSHEESCADLGELQGALMLSSAADVSLVSCYLGAQPVESVDEHTLDK